MKTIKVGDITIDRVLEHEGPFFGLDYLLPDLPPAINTRSFSGMLLSEISKLGQHCVQNPRPECRGDQAHYLRSCNNSTMSRRVLRAVQPFVTPTYARSGSGSGRPFMAALGRSGKHRASR